MYGGDERRRDDPRPALPESLRFIEDYGEKALNELLSAGLIQRVGKGSKGNLFWYFRKAQPHSLLLIRLFGLLRQSARAC